MKHLSEADLLKEKRTDRVFDILYAAGLALFGALLTIIFYRQSIRYNGKYPSDTQYYVNDSKDHPGARLISYIFHYLYKASGDSRLIAVYMALVVVATVLVNYLIIKYMLKRWGKDTRRVTIQAASIAMLFTGSIYIPGILPYFYKKAWTTYAWHSPTQHTMMLFALLALLMFIKIYDGYLDKINIWQWLGLMVFSFLSTWSKPSYILAMTPAVILMFLIELFTRKEYSVGVRIRQLFIYGVAFIPAGLMAIYLSTAYFGEGEEAEGGSIAFGLSHFLESNSHLVFLKIACGLLFPILVYAFNIRRFKDMQLKFALMLMIFSSIEWMLLYEEGGRAAHGNFSWGKKFGCYWFFLCSIPLAIDNYKDKNFLGGNKALRAVYFLLISVAFAAHLICQLYYFYAIARGHGYNF